MSRIPLIFTTFWSFYLLFECTSGPRIIFRGLILHEILSLVGVVAALSLVIYDCVKSLESDRLLEIFTSAALAFFMTNIVTLSFLSSMTLLDVCSVICIVRVVFIVFSMKGTSK